MADIVLSTLNAKYIHSAFGLRYLLANLGPLRPRAEILEFDLHHRPVDLAEALLARQPRVLGLGVYLWNAAPTTELVALLKRLRPDLPIVLGGPEVSFETERQPIAQSADYIIAGEADLAFGPLCEALLAGQRPEPRLLTPPPPDLAELALPYDLYTDEDIRHRLIYVEASRGCPCHCEFCLSALDVPIRQVPLPRFLEALQRLLDRGVRHFKFVDRAFNLNPRACAAILEFLLARYQPGMLFHLEWVPDHLPETLRALLQRFPPGALQLEAGVQTFDPEVAARIDRRQNYPRLEANLRFLRAATGVHLHADLIIGLPGESFDRFAAGFDRLIALGPQEIQVGLLKRLRGAPISRHDAAWDMVYSPHPPYEILQNRLIPFPLMQRLRRFARYWDLVGNSGNFVETTPLLWAPPAPTSAAPAPAQAPAGPAAPHTSPFHAFLAFSDWLFARVRRTDSIALARLRELVFEYLTTACARDPRSVAACLWRDGQRGGRREHPGFLAPYLQDTSPAAPNPPPGPLPRRQARHRG